MQFNVSYTLGRTRDVQSDPVGRVSGEESSRIKRLASAAFYSPPRSFFTRQGDPSSSYGYSDFDQRQNLVFNFIAQSPYVPGFPRLLSGWQVAALAGIRAGVPFSVITRDLYFEPGFGTLQNNRANYWGKDTEDAFLADRTPIPGGVVLLDTEKFEKPSLNEMGNLARNAFRGPGFWNVDFSLSRSFAVPRLGEGASLQFRIELFNAFNHTNLNNPQSVLESDVFGQAFFGRQGVGSSQPSVAPLNEQPRRIQLALKVYF
jgi:hypothetical protein